MLAIDVQIFKIDAVPAYPRRVVEKVKRHTGRLAIPICNDGMKTGRRAESILLQILPRHHDFVRKPLVFRRLMKHSEQDRNVADNGLTNR
jgi:hypothetical protein